MNIKLNKEEKNMLYIFIHHQDNMVLIGMIDCFTLSNGL